METELIKKGGLSKSVLQIIALVAMLIDHLAIFIPNTIYFYIMKFIGRIAVIVMAYFVAEGFHKTSDLGKYITRMGIFALVSQIPYHLYMYRGIIMENPKSLIMAVFNYRNVIFTLFVGLCLLAIIKSEYKNWIKAIAIVAAFYLVRQSDWDYYGLLWVVGFGMLYGSKKWQIMWGALVLTLKVAVAAPRAIASVIAIGTMTYGMLEWCVMFGGYIAFAFLAGYNGERGNVSKWTFYVFYPVHLLMFGLLMMIF